MNKDYALGFRHGSDSEQPDSRGTHSREAYLEGYIAGSQERDKRIAGGAGHVTIPDWMTKAQVDAVNHLYKRSPDGSRDRYEFFTRIKNCGIGSDRYAGITWRGMFVAIEPDGCLWNSHDSGEVGPPRSASSRSPACATPHSPPRT